MTFVQLRWCLRISVGMILWSAPFVLSAGEVNGTVQLAAGKVMLRCTTQASKVAALGPLGLTLAATNVDQVPVTIHVAKDGAPMRWAAQLTGPGGEKMECSFLQVAGRSYSREVVLEPGQETAGTALLVFGGESGGYAFPQQGQYRVKVSYNSPNGSVALAGDLEIDVTEAAPDTRTLIALLEPIGVELFGFDPIRVQRDVDLRERAGTQLIERLIGCESGEIFDVQTERGSRYDRLHRQLRDLLMRYPDTEYSGFVARYLGLHAMKAYERSQSTATPVAHEIASSEDAVAYLNLAASRAAWPVEASLAALGDVHVLRRDWDKVSQTCERLKAIGSAAGTIATTRLDARALKYRAKIERRSPESAP